MKNSNHYQKHVRLGLLTLLEQKGDCSHCFEARFLAVRKSQWLCVSQLKLVDTADKLATHLNLPLHKLEWQTGQLGTIKKGQKIILEAKIGSYTSKGFRRACLIGKGPKNRISVNVE